MSSHRPTRMTPFRADPTSGLMSGARQVPSPNHDARPAGVAPELIVVHGISLPPGEFGGPWIDRLFTNTLPAEAHPYFAEVAGRPVSSHLCIARDGALTQYVSFNERAWHAGVSSYRGPRGLQRFLHRHRARGHRYRRPTRRGSIEYLRTPSPLSARPIRRCPRSGWPATAISPPGARPIRGRPSIGRTLAGSSLPRSIANGRIGHNAASRRLNRGQSPSRRAGLPRAWAQRDPRPGAT